MKEESNNSSSMKLKKLKEVEEGMFARRDIYLMSYIRYWQLESSWTESATVSIPNRLCSLVILDFFSILITRIL